MNKIKKLLLKTNKAQVSIFIVIGIILVIATTFLIYNSDFEIFVSQDTKLKNQASEIIKDCIYKSADQGVFLLSQQGGYIKIPQDIKIDPNKHSNFGFKIPTWDTQKGDIPTINSMENELKQHIEQSSASCISNNLKVLEKAFDIKTNSNLTVDTKINDNSIVITADYPITFNEKNSEEIITITDYTVKLEKVRLGALYNLAIEIYNKESQTNFFEEYVLEQIHSANDYRKSESMPSEGMIMTCAKKVWSYPQLKRNLANLNNNNFRYLQFSGTYSKEPLYEQLENTPETKGFREYYDNLYYVNLENDDNFDNFDVDIFMPSVEINNQEGILKSYPFREFEVTPSSGQVTKSMDMEIDMGGKIPLPCIQTFHHLYSLDYDLILKLTDKTDDENQFTFLFPIRIQIEENQPKKKSYGIITPERNTLNSDTYCLDEYKQYPLMITTTDNELNPIDNVNISYSCVGYSCDMGKTQKPTYMGVVRKYATPQLTTEFPFCINGKVTATKPGYHTTSKRVTTDDDILGRESYYGSNLVELEMTPTKEFLIEGPENFLIINKEDGKGTRVYEENSGSILITVENKGINLESTATWPNEGEYLNKITLLDDDSTKYNLTAYYMDENYKLKGYLEIQNWIPQVSAGEKISFKIPGSYYEITEDKFVEYYEYFTNKSQTLEYQPNIY